jgi:hypothetical protein
MTGRCRAAREQMRVSAETAGKSPHKRFRGNAADLAARRTTIRTNPVRGMCGWPVLGRRGGTNLAGGTGGVLDWVEHAGRCWQIDMTLWLHDPNGNVTCWHEDLRERITAEERMAVLRIKDDWCRRPAYPHQVGGVQICTAVLDDAVRTPGQFAAWLAQQGLPAT